MLPKRKALKWNEKTSAIVKHKDDRKQITWVTSQGKKIPIEEMDTNHLSNAINKIKRGDYQSKEWLLDSLITEKIYREIYSLTKKRKTKNERRELKTISATDIRAARIRGDIGGL